MFRHLFTRLRQRKKGTQVPFLRCSGGWAGGMRGRCGNRVVEIQLKRINKRYGEIKEIGTHIPM